MNKPQIQGRESETMASELCYFSAVNFPSTETINMFKILGKLSEFYEFILIMFFSCKVGIGKVHLVNRDLS